MDHRRVVDGPPVSGRWTTKNSRANFWPDRGHRVSIIYDVETIPAYTSCSTVDGAAARASLRSAPA